MPEGTEEGEAVEAAEDDAATEGEPTGFDGVEAALPKPEVVFTGVDVADVAGDEV